MHYAMSNLIKAVSLWKSYKSGGAEVYALSDVSINIEKGGYLAIVGPSGAGKTTLLNILGGLDTATKGEVFFEGRNISRWGERKISLWRNKSIGFVFQFYHLIEELTVLENVMLPSLLYKDTKTSLKEAKNLLKYLEIDNKSYSFPSQLSGGEKQKVAIARALVNEPQVVFCDEPTGNLDRESSKKVIAFLEMLNADKKKAIVIVTHNIELAKRAGRIVEIKDGRIDKTWRNS